MPKKDLLVPIKPHDLAAILARQQAFVFGKHDLKGATRLWLYETYPVSSLRYLATVGPVKRPGQIPTEPHADAFNARSLGATYAYEIRRLEQLDEPVPYKLLVERKWAKGAPQPFAYPLPAMLEMMEKGRIGRRVVFDVRREAEAGKAEAKAEAKAETVGKAETVSKAGEAAEAEMAEKTETAKKVEKEKEEVKAEVGEVGGTAENGLRPAIQVDKKRKRDETPRARQTSLSKWFQQGKKARQA